MGNLYLYMLSFIMSRQKQIGIRLASVLMLCVFTGIMANYILCNFAHAVDATGREHDHAYGHDHHHDGSSPLAEHEHKDKGHEHNSGEDCCNDFTFSFFASLQRSNTSTFKLNINVNSVALLLPIFINPLAEKNLFKGVRDYIEPPPKIPDIRVFIESFQV